MSKTIEEAAREFAEREAEIGSIDRDALYKGFYWGAQHILSLPLSERLTDKEKAVIRAEYKAAYKKRDILRFAPHRDEYSVGRAVGGVEMLETIFKDMF